MFPEINVELLIQQHAASVADRMHRVARIARSEEEVRHECNKLIEVFLVEAGIEPRGRHEYGLAGGRVDSKYGGVIIEYKHPRGAGSISTDPHAAGTRAAAEQVRQRFRDFQADEHIEPERLFGAACDGNAFVFVRRRGGKFEVEPQPVTPYSVERLLRALLSLGARGKSFTPDHLAEQFGADSELAQKGVRDIYRVIKDTSDRKAKTFFNQWKILFGEVCGYDVEGRNEKIQRLGEHYGVRNSSPAELLFALHTYYAVFMKFLAAEIAGAFSPLGASVVKRCVGAATPEKLKREVATLEQGGIWTELGITNFLEGDLFSWYLSAWDERMAGAVWGVVRKLDEFDPTTLSVEPAESRDLLKKLYQHLFPKSVRHDLGEYYTPDWLAEFVLDEVGFEGDPDERLLDPACGSGTFLVMAVNRVKQWFRQNRDQCGYGEEELVRKILENVIGFDLNPLAVMAARTNVLLAIRDLLKFAGRVELPVYLCDSVMTPANYSANGYEFNYHQLKTAVDTFNIPQEIVGAEHIGVYADTIESCVRGGYSGDEFLARCREEGLPVTQDGIHRRLYDKLCKLDSKNQNGIWARIIKNSFAPLFVGRVDYVVGNPPWVNWESLPDEYRDRMKPLWQRYGLFTLSGAAGRLGGGKKDLSMLFVYGGIDNYLVDDGRLGFVITQTVFKTTGAGDGFRRLRFAANGGPAVVIKPLVVHDLSSMQVFEGATNRTAVLVCQRQTEDFNYPVPYVVWRGPSRLAQDTQLAAVFDTTTRQHLRAMPVTQSQPNSPWLTAPEDSLAAIGKASGAGHYSAFEGVNTGGLNGCYWVRVLNTVGSEHLLVANMHDVGKILVERVEAVIEPDLVYPLVRGRDVIRWGAQPSAHLVLAQDPIRGKGIAESEMKRKHPKTYSFLRRFEGTPVRPKRGTLRGRSLFRMYFKQSDPFYSMYGVGTYTLAPWKVMWPEVGNTVRAGVCGPSERDQGKPALPDHTVVAVACENQEEAHYVCALLNSAPAQLAVSGYIVLHPSPHVLEHIAIPQYNAADENHARLAQLSAEAHAATAAHRTEVVQRIEGEIDRAAAQLWGITETELEAILDALEEQNRKWQPNPTSPGLDFGDDAE